MDRQSGARFRGSHRAKSLRSESSRIDGKWCSVVRLKGQELTEKAAECYLSMSPEDWTYLPLEPVETMEQAL